MSDITEILGEKKFSGAKTIDLKTRIVFEETNKIQYENNLFFDISQQKQYITEKEGSDVFRIYGKINPIISKNVHIKTIFGDSKVNLDRSIFDFTLNNWSVVVLKSKQITNTDGNGNVINVKGVKSFSKIKADFTKGLPAKIYVSPQINDNVEISFVFGHNLVIGDRIKITQVVPNTISDGVYNVLDVNDNVIMINLLRSPRTTNNHISINTKDVAAVDIKDITLVNDVNKTILTNNNTKVIGGINMDDLTLATLSEPRPKLQPFIEPDIYVSKIVENEIAEYYIKTLEVIGIIDEIDDCAFSINTYESNLKNIFLNQDLSINNLLNNKGEPLTDIYIGIVKNTPNTLNLYSDVESHFKDYIEDVSIDDGIEKITNSTKTPGNRVKIGDTFFYSISENLTESLIETDINFLYHRFIHRDVLFSYKPFYKVDLKIKSTYIEDSDSISNVPFYSVFSKLKQKYIWRDIFDIGIADENGNTIDFPFMNGSFYVFNTINFFVTSEKKLTRKYELNKNDVTSIGNNLIDLTNDPTPLQPYKNFKDFKC